LTSTTITLENGGKVIVEEYTQPYVTGDRIHKAVGSFEVLTCGRICLWFHDEVESWMDPNFNATMVGASFAQQEIPTIHGPALITGPADAQGNTNGLTHDQVQRILKLTQ
jgi:hypothetical protein